MNGRKEHHPRGALQGQVTERGAAVPRRAQRHEGEEFSSAQNLKTLKNGFLLLPSPSPPPANEIGFCKVTPALSYA